MTELSPDLLGRWHGLLDADVARESPFLHPDYVAAVGEVRSDVEVGVLEEDGRPVGFLPFQRSRFGIGGAVGGRLCDLSGPLVAPEVTWDPIDLARGLGLRALRLPNVPTMTDGWRRFQRHTFDAPVMDLSSGYDAYREASLDSGSSLIRQLDRKARKVEREIGPIRFEWKSTDSRVFDLLLAWKASQRKATRSPNVLELPWARALVESLVAHRTDTFSGVLSALYVGDELAAAHFGIRTRRVLHYWIPAYNIDLAKYSPGLLALQEIARAASQRGIERIDLGSGEEKYKLRASTGSMELAASTVCPSPAVRTAADAVDRLRDWSKGSGVGRLLRSAGRGVTRCAYAARSLLRSDPSRTSDDQVRGGVFASNS